MLGYSFGLFEIVHTLCITFEQFWFNTSKQKVKQNNNKLTNLDILRNGYNSKHHKSNSHAGHFFVKKKFFLRNTFELELLWSRSEIIVLLYKYTRGYVSIIYVNNFFSRFLSSVPAPNYPTSKDLNIFLGPFLAIITKQWPWPK